MASIPHFHTTGGITQLIVNEKPFLILGGELGNSVASDDKTMASIWPKLRQLHLNTVLAPVYWDLLEPQEGQFDFTQVDDLITVARKNDSHLVLLWFGVWKNSMSTYTPAWVKHDRQRFPYALDKQGRSVEILSPFNAETHRVDETAFAALMKHLRQTDGDHHTVLMLQVENEIGFLPDARDHSPTANAAFTQPVPRSLVDYLQSHHDTLNPSLRVQWEKNGAKTDGTWTDVFGPGVQTDELFMAWQYGIFVNTLAERGKAEYPLPMYVNAALNRPGRLPGEYPSAGPIPHLIDIWKAAAPYLDMLSPDVYFADYENWVKPYVRPDNALFVPETVHTSRAAANCLLNFGRHNAIGFSPFAIEDTPDPAHNLLGQTYSALRQLTSQIAQTQGTDKLAAVAPKINYDGTVDGSPQQITVGNYVLTVSFDGIQPLDPHVEMGGAPATRGDQFPSCGGLILFTDNDAYIVIGTGIKIMHTTTTGERVGLLNVREWKPVDGQWTPSQCLNGDQTNQGRDVHLYGPNLGMQTVQLYRY